MSVPIENSKAPAPRLQNFKLIFGVVCFAIGCFLVLNHLGFISAEDTYTREFKPILSRNMLWIVNIALGMVGALVIDLKHPLASAIGGAVGMATLTLVSLLYFGWRESMINLEIAIPFFAALIVGGITYNVCMGLFGYRKKDAAASDSQ